jgi:hypothetical protein
METGRQTDRQTDRKRTQCKKVIICRVWGPRMGVGVRQASRQVDRQAGRQTDRQASRQTGR